MEGPILLGAFYRTGRMEMSYYRFVALLTAALIVAVPVRPQDATRHLWDTAFLTPAPKAQKQHGQSSSKPHYTILTPSISPKNVDPGAVIGVTVWQLRQYKAGDQGERLLVHKGATRVELEPRRVSAQTVFRKDDKVRISVEAAHEGYLYVVDQEEYRNGKLGEPYLIFPVSTIRGGENHLLPAQIAEIPAQDDDPPYFEIKMSRPDHIGEQLTILLSPSPLKDVVSAPGEQRLSSAQFAEWERNAHINAGMAEMEASVYSSWSSEEKKAGLNPVITLPAGAPHPQLLFYNPQTGADSPIIVKLVLKYAPQRR